MAVGPEQGRVGRARRWLEDEVEARRTLIIIETSSQPKYEPTAGSISIWNIRSRPHPRFYQAGDDRVIYAKYFVRSQEMDDWQRFSGRLRTPEEIARVRSGRRRGPQDRPVFKIQITPYYAG